MSDIIHPVDWEWDRHRGPIVLVTGKVGKARALPDHPWGWNSYTCMVSIFMG